MKNKKILMGVLLAGAIFSTIALLQALLMPKYMTGVIEGALIAEYYEETTPHDVIFIGDCEVYGNFSPITLWEEYGIPSYIRGSAQQLMWQSYYLLEETLKYETPQVVIFNVLAMKYDEPQSEAYNRMTLDGMKMSSSKIKSIRASMLEEESFFDYLVPFFRYHSRWNELTKDDFTYVFNKDKISHNGYYMRADINPATTFPTPRKLADYSFGETSYYYLDKMVELCKANDIELILIKAPSLYPHWYDEWDEQMVAYAEANGLKYINFLDEIEEIGLDFEVDTYDGGLHLNVTGAEKLTRHLGEYLIEETDLQDRRDDETFSLVWEEKVDFYHETKAQQYMELEELGYISRYKMD